LAPTPSRLETSATAAHAADLHGVLLDQFIASARGTSDHTSFMNRGFSSLASAKVPIAGACTKKSFLMRIDSSLL
jgi:hypothetical protein